MESFIPVSIIPDVSWMHGPGADQSHHGAGRRSASFYLPSGSNWPAMRLLHRVERRDGSDATWAALGDSTVLDLHPGARFEQVVAQESSEVGLVRSFGRIDDQQWETLFGAMSTFVPAKSAVHVAVWEGLSSSDPDWESSLPTVRIGERSCFVGTVEFHTLAGSRDLNNPPSPIASPYAWWLADRSLYAVTDIDQDSTLIMAEAHTLDVLMRLAVGCEFVRIARSSDFDS